MQPSAGASSGSSLISRRVSLIQRAMHQTVRITPTTVNSMNVVMPTSASVMPTAVSSGRMLGPGEVDLLADGRDLGVERAHET